MNMAMRKVMMSGKTYVLVPLKQWEALMGRPKALPDGAYTLQDVRASLANKVAARRKAAGLTQKQLADRAAVRVETISRLESALHMPSVRIFEKIERALKSRSSKVSAA
jgi:ribosome-binding protein aMBF1 (putative translation factor)